ncbi:MAG: winged helix DNA-binding domain-containing protein [Anaerolineae bacterium]|nr:winged helix DNA-binding domain-containing protein [Anaerolineae bacterium]MDH7472790.1 crosslink repair DNA glycosylase YcaQ family protein [Anaerolineae bacterium]
MTALTWLQLESRVTPDEIKRRRDFNYRRTPERRVRTVEEARAFVEEVGFCHFWPIKGVELPNLFHAIAGCERPVPMEHDDPDIGKCWGWKDESLDKKWWYYGKFLRRKATLISLTELPYFYALSENYGSLDDYLQEYAEGRMTAEAKAIYEAILEHGPLDTIRLRREARMSAQSAKSALERALVELQVGLKILPVGIAEAGAWRYAFIYELLPRWFPDIPEQARAIGRGEAHRHILLRYLRSVVAATPAQVARLFGWSETEVERAAAKLAEAGEITVWQTRA